MVIDYLLSRSKLLVLDEAFDGLDAASREGLTGAVREALSSEAGASSAAVLIAHLPEELAPQPTHALMLGQGADQTGYHAGVWEAMAPRVDAFFASHRDADDARFAAAPAPPAATANASAAAAGSSGSAADAAPLIEFRGVTVAYPPDVVVLDELHWAVRAGEKWAVVGGNGTGKSTIIELVTGANMQVGAGRGTVAAPRRRIVETQALQAHTHTHTRARTHTAPNAPNAPACHTPRAPQTHPVCMLCCVCHARC